jgi:DNA (cytosine-5)-methyltransferase 1
VDVIVGGPPCQGFSKVRRVDGANNGARFVHDARRYLYQEFLAYVAWFQPRVFVLENVLGLKTAAGGEFFTRVQAEARALGYRVHGEEIRAWHYGVPQKRIRQLIIGTRRELPIFTALRFMPQRFAAPGDDLWEVLEPAVTLWEAIGDLPPLAAGEGTEEADYDPRRRQSQLARYGGRYLKRVLQIHRVRRLTAHTARPHSDRDLRDFARLNEGESSAAAMRRGVEFEWPYSKDHFKDRYTRQHRHRLCSTIVAHLSKDGLMFIHPTQNRSLTPREAARVQSFPDWFEFPVARTHQFRLIGNAVPPLVKVPQRHTAPGNRQSNRTMRAGGFHLQRCLRESR